MQITFDPLNMVEVQQVQACLAVIHALVPMKTVEAADMAILNAQHGKPGDPVVKLMPHADRPDVGASPEVQFAPSAAPLPPEVPAPFTAAAELFPTAPAAAPASVPPAPPVPSPPAVAAPPVPPALSAPASPPSPAPAGELDKNGLPWDERIHASTKAKNADGSWRQRRGLNDDALLKRIEAELRVMVAVTNHPGNPLPGEDPVLDAKIAEASGNVPPASSAATAVVPPPPVTPAGPSVVPAPPVPAGVSSAVPTAPPAPAQASIKQPLSFGDMMSKLITRNIAAGLLKEEQVHAIMARPGVDLQPTQIGVLAGDADKRHLVVEGLRELNLPEE